MHRQRKNWEKYEFGHKVSLAVSATTNWVVAALGLKDNPFDGHTLEATLQKAEQNINRTIKEVYVDRGYKGHGCDANIVTIDRERRRTLTRTVWKKLKHRSAIEPVIGHLKSDCRLERNYLTGEEGNAINAILSAAGYNFRKLLKELVKLFVLIRIMLQGRMIAQLPSI
ncbi:MAG: transposase [Akkermansia sp.]